MSAYHFVVGKDGKVNQTSSGDAIECPFFWCRVKHHVMTKHNGERWIVCRGRATRIHPPRTLADTYNHNLGSCDNE